MLLQHRLAAAEWVGQSYDAQIGTPTTRHHRSAVRTAAGNDEGEKVRAAVQDRHHCHVLASKSLVGALQTRQGASLAMTHDPRGAWESAATDASATTLKLVLTSGFTLVGGPGSHVAFRE